MSKQIISRFNGTCALCGKPYYKGDKLKHDDAFWSHARCVNKRDRENAAIRRLDENAEVGNSRRWQTS